MILNLFNATQGSFLKDCPGHVHAKNCYEIHYVTEGEGSLLTLDGDNFVLKKNSLYVTGPGIYHMQKTDKTSPMYECCLFFELEQGNDDFFLDIFMKNNFWIGKCNRKMRKIILDIYQLFSNNTLYHNRKAKLMLQLLILELAQQYEPDIANLTMDSDSGITNDTMLTDLFFLCNKTDVSLGALAKTLGLSERQTQRVIKKNYGKTFQQKKLDAQLENAKLLLSNTTFSLQRIAEECGFCSSSAFCNSFKKQTDMTPSAYREQN